MKTVDMSDKAITRRLKQTDQLRELSLSLMKAKKLQDEKSDQNNKKSAKNNESPKTKKL